MCFRKNLEHHLPNEVFRVLSFHFFWSDINGYDNRADLYIYIHTQDSRYITYPKKCVTNDGKGIFSR